jgi:hypothetical protein
VAYAPFSDQINNDNYKDNEGGKHYHDQSEGRGHEISSTLTLLTWRIWRAPTNATK